VYAFLLNSFNQYVESKSIDSLLILYIQFAINFLESVVSLLNSSLSSNSFNVFLFNHIIAAAALASFSFSDRLGKSCSHCKNQLTIEILDSLSGKDFKANEYLESNFVTEVSLDTTCQIK